MYVIKGQGPGLVNVLWAGTTMHEHFSYRDVKTSIRVVTKLPSTGPAERRESEWHSAGPIEPSVCLSAIADREAPAPPLRNPSAHRTWTRHRASSGHERPSSARGRPGASPRSSARKSASWRRWRSMLWPQMRRRHRLSRTAPGSRASRSRLRVELVGPSR